MLPYLSVMTLARLQNPTTMHVAIIVLALAKHGFTVTLKLVDVSVEIVTTE